MSFIMGGLWHHISMGYFIYKCISHAPLWLICLHSPAGVHPQGHKFIFPLSVRLYPSISSPSVTISLSAKPNDAEIKYYLDFFKQSKQSKVCPSVSMGDDADLIFLRRRYKIKEIAPFNSLFLFIWEI